MMEWDDLRSFLAVARSGSLREAARALKTSPATVGRRIASLEEQLGARLFDRTKDGHVITESGAEVRLKAENVEEAVAAVERVALGRDLRPTGKVRLATTNDIATLVIGPHLGSFRRNFPDILLEIVAGAEVANLSMHEADIALRTIRPTQGNVVVRHVGWWKLGLYAARQYAEVHKLKPGLKDWSEADIVTWNEEIIHRRGGAWLNEHAPDAAVALTGNTRGIHRSACKAGLGIAVLPSLMADNDPDLVCLLPPEHVISVELWLVAHRDLTRTARVRAVMDFVADACGQTKHRCGMTG